MTAKRFTLFNDGETIIDNETVADDGGKEFYWTVEYVQRVKLVELLNELHEKNQELRLQLNLCSDQRNEFYRGARENSNRVGELEQDNNALIHLLENQSMIIQELHSKLLEYQIKEPIILTKEDLELMGKAISYYTHGRCVE